MQTLHAQIFNKQLSKENKYIKERRVDDIRREGNINQMRWVEYKNTSFQPFQKDRAERHLCQRRKLHILSTISTINVVQEVASRELTYVYLS